MAEQNINQYSFQKFYLYPISQNMDLSLASDERDYDDEVVFSENLIAYLDGNRLPIQIDINDLDSSPLLDLTYGNYNINNILLSTNYWNPDNLDLSCFTAFTLCGIGLTGTDNGLVEELSGETITVTNGLAADINKFNRLTFDRRFKMFQVTGYTSPPNERFSGYTSRTLYEVISKTGNTEGVYHELYGGFYQGFYKLFGYEYEVFPERMPKGWTVEFLLKPRLYPEYFTSATANTLNDQYPDNKNMFFYLGARGENKYYHYADGYPSSDTGYTRVTSGLTCLTTCACANTAVTNSDCISVYPPSAITVNHAYGVCGYYNEIVMNPEKDPAWDSISNAISLRFCGDLSNPKLGVKVLRFVGDCEITGSCENTGLTYVTGYTITEYCSPNGIYDVCLLNNTGNTFIYDEHWVQIDVVFERYTFFDECDLIYRGGLGSITDVLYEDTLLENSVALIQPPITHDFIDPETVEITLLNEKWLLEKKYRMGNLKFYVNGMLFYTIEDFEEVIPRPLNVEKEKQIGVPFNISVGGGTQGLHESLIFSGCPMGLTNNYIQDPELVPNEILSATTLSALTTNILIEQNFASNFDGALAQFRMYIEPLSAAQIQHNFRLLKDKFDLFDFFCENNCYNIDFTCGSASISADSISNCGEDTFSIDVNIQDITTFPINTIDVYHNNLLIDSFQAYSGITNIGPFSSILDLDIVITNDANPICNYLLTGFTDLSVPLIQYLVDDAVDVNFESGSTSGVTYLIVSNIDNITNSWSTHVGDILSGNTWISPINKDFIKNTSLVGPSSYWESRNGGAVRVFPSVIFEYREVSQDFYFSIQSASTFSDEFISVVSYSCNGGSGTTIYSGITNSLTIPDRFDPPCSITGLTGTITYYSDNCVFTLSAATISNKFI